MQVVIQPILKRKGSKYGKTKSMHPPPPARRVYLWCIFLALPLRNGPLPAELNFGENTGLDQYIVSMIDICHG